MRSIWIAVSLAVALGLSACNRTDEAKKEAKKTVAEAAHSNEGAAKPDEVNGATLTGSVIFTGAKPARRTIDMSANPVCQRAHPTPQESEEVVMNPNGTLRYAFVWIKSGLPDRIWAVPGTSALLKQTGCMYQPHVIGIMAGQQLTIRNNDATNHNIHPLPSVNQEWNESQPPQSEDMIRTFARQEVMIPVKCNVHPWMRAYIGVVSHPFFAVTGEDGTYKIKGVPPGTYVVECWQEKYGVEDQQITVGPKDSRTIDFTYKGAAS